MHSENSALDELVLHIAPHCPRYKQNPAYNGPREITVKRGSGLAEPYDADAHADAKQQATATSSDEYLRVAPANNGVMGADANV